MRLEQGDHICALYATPEDLAPLVAAYLAEGLRRGERCWFMPSADGTEDTRSAMRALGVDVDREVARGALIFPDANAAYAVRGRFDPEESMAVFSAAIEQALNDGFTGLRAAAEMSWVLAAEEGAELIVTYEALLKSLFSSSRATGMCLYPRDRIPSLMTAGALATHPIMHTKEDGYSRNASYDPSVRAASDVAAPGASR